MKKELQSCFITHNGDYIVLVKWYKNDKIEYVVAYSWNPCGIATGESEWGGGRYFGNPVDAHDYYLKLVNQESKIMVHFQ